MILYFSGGGSPWIPEMQLEDAAVMTSFWVNVKGSKMNGKIRPDKRTTRLMKARKRAKLKGKK